MRRTLMASTTWGEMFGSGAAIGTVTITIPACGPLELPATLKGRQIVLIRWNPTNPNGFTVEDPFCAAIDTAPDTWSGPGAKERCEPAATTSASAASNLIKRSLFVFLIGQIGPIGLIRLVSLIRHIGPISHIRHIRHIGPIRLIRHIDPIRPIGPIRRMFPSVPSVPSVPLSNRYHGDCHGRFVGQFAREVPDLVGKTIGGGV